LFVVDAEWQFWGEWSACTTSCERGSRHRSRPFIPGRNGGEAKPTGNQKEKEDCNAEVKCPGIRNSKPFHLTLSLKFEYDPISGCGSSLDSS
jgi:hypothetical protein